MLGRQLVGLDARAQFQKKFIKFDTDLAVGTLVALDPTTYNKGVVADKASAYPAVGFVYQGSAEAHGEAAEKVSGAQPYNTYRLAARRFCW